jgi:hypothetical protein
VLQKHGTGLYGGVNFFKFCIVPDIYKKTIPVLILFQSLAAAGASSISAKRYAKKA